VAFGLINNAISPTAAAGMMSFISMQLIEYFAWGNLTNKATIALLSKLGLLLIFIQPFLLTVSALSPALLYPFLGAYLGFVIITFTYFYPVDKIDFTMHEASNGHLAWDWLEVPHIVAFVWLGFVAFPLLYTKQYWLSMLIILSFLTCYALYLRTNTWGSMWCWIANVISLALIATVFAKEVC